MELWNFTTTTKIIDLPDCETLPSSEGGDYLECFIPYNNGRARRDINSTGKYIYYTYVCMCVLTIIHVL